MYRTRLGRSAKLRIGAFALTATGFVSVFSPPSPAAANSMAVNLAVANATGVQGRYTIPDYFIVTELFNGGGPTTQSVVDRSGRSTAYSALPYPGDNVVTAPGLLALGSGQSIPVSYPLYAQATHPQVPTSETKDPTGSYSLVSRAEATKAASDAALRFADSVSESASHAESYFEGEQSATATATTSDRGISVGDGTLRIASVKSRSVATLRPGEERPSTSTELLVEGATVAGHPVIIDRQGVRFDQTAVPLPLASGSPGAEEALRQGGITVTILTGGPLGDGTGSSSDVLLVTVKHPIPAPGNPQGAVELRFGGARTFLGVGAGPDLVQLPEPGDLPGPAGSAATTEGAGNEGGDLGLPASGVSVESPGGVALSAAAPVFDAPVPAAGPTEIPAETKDPLAAPVVATGRPQAAAVREGAIRPFHSVEFAYILILAAGLLFGGTHWIIGSRETRTL